MHLLNLTTLVCLVFLHCDIGVAVKVVLLPFVLHDYAIGCKIYLVLLVIQEKFA